MSFGYGGDSQEQSSATTEDKTMLNGGVDENNPVSLDDEQNNGSQSIDNNGENNQQNGNGEDNSNKNDESNDLLEEGTIIETEDGRYTVDKDGNLIDEKGQVFKEAKDVKDYIAKYEVSDDDTLSIDSIKSKLGIEIIGEDDAPIQFDNTPDGVAAYVDAVIEQKQDELIQLGANKLIDNFPFIKDIINYYVANGDSLEGFNEIRDRSNIVIDDNNVAQQEAIIREDWRENNRRGDVNRYIEYLKSSDTLLDTAKDVLQSMVQADKEERERLAEQAEQAEREREERSNKYWKGVQEAISKRKIAGYEIPETIVVNKNGRKEARTLNDFFNYIYQVDDEGRSRYVNDLSKLTPEERRDDELLRAYLRFTGGNYSDLVNIAIREKEVKTLRLKAANNSKRGVTVTPPANSNKPATSKETNYGYNN